MANKDTCNIRVLNMSAGTPDIHSWEDGPLCQTVYKLVGQAVIVLIKPDLVAPKKIISAAVRRSLQFEGDFIRA